MVWVKMVVCELFEFLIEIILVKNFWGNFVNMGVDIFFVINI